MAVITHPNGSEARHAVLPRNLSRWGMSFMIGRFVYPKSTARIFLPTKDGEVLTVTSQIARCTYFEGMIHECGVKFDQPIDLNLFLDLSAEQDSRQMQESLGESFDVSALATEEIGPPLILVVCDFKVNRRLFGLWLGQLGLKIVEAESVERAQQAMKTNDIEAVLIDHSVSQNTGLQLIETLRAGAFHGPIVAIPTEDNEQARREATEAGANGCIAKPFDRKILTQLLKKLMSLAE